MERRGMARPGHEGFRLGAKRRRKRQRNGAVFVRLVSFIQMEMKWVASKKILVVVVVVVVVVICYFVIV